jgi:hypothetical protein
MAENAPIRPHLAGGDCHAAGPWPDLRVSRVPLARRPGAELELTEEQWEEVRRLTGADGIVFTRFGGDDAS